MFCGFGTLYDKDRDPRCHKMSGKEIHSTGSYDGVINLHNSKSMSMDLYISGWSAIGFDNAAWVYRLSFAMPVVRQSGIWTILQEDGLQLGIKVQTV